MHRSSSTNISQVFLSDLAHQPHTNSNVLKQVLPIKDNNPEPPLLLLEVEFQV